MRLVNTVLGLIALFSLGFGSYMIPPDLPDGIWVGSIDDTGETTLLTKVGEVPEDHVSRRQSCRVATAAAPNGTTVEVSRVDGGSSSSNATSSVEKRDATGCTGHRCDPLHYYIGYQGLYNSCPDHWQPVRTFTTWVVCQTFWFVCNYRYSAYRCYRNDLTITLNSVRYRCGDYMSGWDYLSLPDVSWGVEVVGYAIC